MRRAQNQQMRAQLPSPPCPPAELPLPQTSTLRSRRRLANILVTAGFVYMLCWLPHVWCFLIREFYIDEGCSNTAKEFFMLLGSWAFSFRTASAFSRFRSQDLRIRRCRRSSTGSWITTRSGSRRASPSPNSTRRSGSCDRTWDSRRRPHPRPRAPTKPPWVRSTRSSSSNDRRCTNHRRHLIISTEFMVN